MKRLDQITGSTSTTLERARALHRDVGVSAGVVVPGHRPAITDAGPAEWAREEERRALRELRGLPTRTVLTCGLERVDL